MPEPVGTVGEPAVLPRCLVKGRIERAMKDRPLSKSQGTAGEPWGGDPHSGGLPWNDSLDLRRAIEESGKDLDRLIVVRPNRDDDVSYLEELFQSAGRPIPAPLQAWETRVDTWCDEYRDQFGPSSILEVNLKIAVYVFDQSLERVLLAYGISSPQLEDRDKNRMRRFPDVNVGVGGRVSSGRRRRQSQRANFHRAAARRRTARTGCSCRGPRSARGGRRRCPARPRWADREGWGRGRGRFRRRR